jgi:hypothetical protein
MMISRTTSLASALLVVALVGCGTSDIKKPGTGGTGGDTGGTGGSTGGTGGSTGGTSGTGGSTGGTSGTGGSTGGTSGTGGSIQPDAGPDASPDSSTDLAPPPDMAPACVAGASCALAGGGKGVCKNNACSACLEPVDDALCNGAYGPGNICINGACALGTCHTSQQCGDQKICDTASHTCVACAADSACKTDSVYGAQTICIAGKCLVGNCHDQNSDCRQGQICGLSVPHACAACTTDTQCDTRFMNGTICVEGACVVGDCRASTDCTAAKDGLICGVKTANTCGKCTNDAQCQADARYKNTRNLCKTTAGANNGECLTNTCANNGQACAANTADFCCSNKCVPGNCCADTDCTGMGANFTCSKNTCTQCELAAGNQYFVDPVNGSDSIGTGSGKAGGAAMAKCSFRTVTRALRWIGDNPPSGTTITIVGAAGATTDVYSVAPANATEQPEAAVVEVPANVKITTSKGAIRWRLPLNAIALRFVGNGSSLIPADGARLTIDGTGDTSGSGVVFNLAAGVATIENVTIQNTGDDGVRVLKGKGVIGPGVTISDAGTAINKQSGVLVTAGTAEIRGGNGADQTIIQNNKEYGISVTGTGEVNVINGVPVVTPAPTGAGTIVVKGNALGGVYIAQAGAALNINDITGLVSWGNTGPGLKVLGGSKLKLRKSVLLSNTGSGIVVNQTDATAPGNDTTGIDLGKAFDAGANHLQMATAPGTHPNTESGICVSLALTQGAHAISALGNVFAGPRNCAAANPGKLLTSVNCGDKVDLALPVVAGTTVTVDTTGCTQ